MPSIEFLLRMAVALGIGGLIGLEREYHRREEKTVIAGVRTYPLISMSGMVLATLDAEYHIGMAAIAGLALFGAVAIAYFYIKHTIGVQGLTSPMAVVVTYITGLLIGFGLIAEGIAVGVATALLLVAKGRIHTLIRHLTESEVIGALQFLAIAFILFPMIPAQRPSGSLPVGPFDLYAIYSYLNPSWVLLIVLFVSSISFISFLLMRWLGPGKGMEISGLLGGLVNSEAAAASLAGYARDSRELRFPVSVTPVTEKREMSRLAVKGIILANLTMLLRNLLIAGFSDLTLSVARPMLIPLGVMMVVSTVFLPRTGSLSPGADGGEMKLKNPFAILPALRFAALFTLVSVVIALLGPLGRSGAYFAAIGGLVSSAAVTASVAALAFGGLLPPDVAAETAVLACVISTLNKVLLTRAVSRSVSRHMGVSMVAVGASGLVALALVAAIGLVR